MKGNILLIKDYFSTPTRPVAVDELKKLTPEDKS